MGFISNWGKGSEGLGNTLVSHFDFIPPLTKECGFEGTQGHFPVNAVGVVGDLSELLSAKSPSIPLYERGRITKTPELIL